MSALHLEPPLEQAALPFVALDETGRFLALNPAAERLYGRPAAQLVGAPFAEVVDTYSREKAEHMVSRTLAEGSVTDWELNHPRPDGPPTLVSYSTWIWCAGPEYPLAVAALGQPLSAAVSLAAQLAASNQQLEGALLQLERAHTALKEAQTQLVRSEKMRVLGQLIAGVAHEVNTPLAFVVNNLEFLSDSLATLHQLHDRYYELAAHTPPLADQLRAAADAVGAEQIWDDVGEVLPESQAGLGRIASIVQALRSFARPDSPGTQSADLNAALAGTVRIARSISRPGLTISETYEPIPHVICNPGEINQVALNLLTNAIQAVETGGEVSLRSTREGDAVVITVSDTGSGMDEITLARLGEPFFTTRALGAGTGLGIAISRGLVERHGGRLEFQSTPGKGTTARIVLPIERHEA